jgi:hypothetical protein
MLPNVLVFLYEPLLSSAVRLVQADGVQEAGGIATVLRGCPER